MATRTLVLSTCLVIVTGQAAYASTSTLHPEGNHSENPSRFSKARIMNHRESKDSLSFICQIPPLERIPIPKALLERADSFGWKSANVQEDQFRFNSLVAKWQEERGVLSSITEIAMCPSYQRIIAMGKDAIPLILARLESEGDEPRMWFWALKVISGEDPVTDSDRGNFKAMATAWLRWDRERDDW